MSDDQRDEILPSSTGIESAYDLAAITSSMVPWLGGPVSGVLSGISLGMKMDRVGEVLTSLDTRIRDLESEEAKAYVKTGEFQELLERTLRQVADERSVEKRQVYAAFLAGDIESPDEPYDEKIRFLRILEELQADHIRILRAMMEEPEDVGRGSGSIAQTLNARLPELGEDRISDLDAQLQDLRIVRHGGLNSMMTARGAQQLHNYITPLGERIVSYIMQEHPDA